MHCHSIVAHMPLPFAGKARACLMRGGGGGAGAVAAVGWKRGQLLVTVWHLWRGVCVYHRSKCCCCCVHLWGWGLAPHSAQVCADPHPLGVTAARTTGEEVACAAEEGGGGGCNGCNGRNGWATRRAARQRRRGRAAQQPPQVSACAEHALRMRPQPPHPLQAGPAGGGG